MQNSEVCSFLEWDSSWFGLRIGRIMLSRLTPLNLESALLWCQKNRIDCLYFLAASDHLETIQIISEKRFKLVDIRLNFVKCLPPTSLHNINGSYKIRPFQPSDMSRLREMAGVLHLDSRFIFDSGFPKAKGRAMFQVWIEKLCLDGGEGVFVAEIQNRAVGYIGCRCSNHQSGQIELVGVEESAQGLGIGEALVRTSLSWFASKGISKVSVVTQGRNIRAQRLYQKCGFVTESLDLWYHCWFDTSAAGMQGPL